MSPDDQELSEICEEIRVNDEDENDPFYTRSNDRRALVTIRIHEQPYEALADTGAQICCMYW